MRFSFSLIKKLVPGEYTKEALIEKLNLHSFEAVDLGGDILEIAITPNRFSDAASYLGIAREAAVIMNLKLSDPSAGMFKPDIKERGMFTVNIKEKKLCNRYMAAYVTNIRINSAPDWMRDILESCGLRPINNVVDIMNYVMLELGQPMHAFDADKISGGIIVRSAKRGEVIETIDDNKFDLSQENLVIADARSALAIAGIKGGKSSEVTSKTKHILIEAANFDGGNIYRSSRKLGLATDASVRFSHQLSPELVPIAMARALQLLRELAGAKIYSPVDVYPKKQSKKIIKFDIKKINGLVGYEFSARDALKTLQALGFKKVGLRLEVPALRSDIEDIEDLAEEVVRFHGYSKLVAVAPTVALGVAGQEDQVTLKDRLRSFLVSAGFTEVYNYSFLPKKDVGNSAVEILNPISSQSGFLRDSLKPYLIKNLEGNRRFFDSVRVFEIGKVFSQEKGKVSERLNLGIGLCVKDSHLELKGLLDSLMGSLGVTDNEIIAKSDGHLVLEIDGKTVGDLELVSELRDSAVAELNLEDLINITTEEREFKALPKFPSITRDLSIFVPADVRVGDLLDLIQRVSSKLVNDVDLIDFYEPPLENKRDRSGDPEKRRKSLTFRIIFQADDRTLTDAEADREMAAINQMLIDKFDAELR